MEQEFKNYPGPFFIRVETEQILTQTSIVDFLNTNSKRIINDFEQPGFTIWEMLDLSSSLTAVLRLQKDRLPFALTGEDGILFIEQLA